MTDRVLNEADLVVIERYLSREPHLWWAARTQEVIASHRLLQQQVNELEEQVANWKEAFGALDV